MNVKITKRRRRGFHQYGRPVVCTYGSKVEVYESSAASGPHVWLSIDAAAWHEVRDHVSSSKPAQATAHLNAKQARAVIARLQAWVDEIPSRWKR